MGDTELETFLDKLLEKIDEQEKRIHRLERKMRNKKMDKSVIKVLEGQK